MEGSAFRAPDGRGGVSTVDAFQLCGAALGRTDWTGALPCREFSHPRRERLPGDSPGAPDGRADVTRGRRRRVGAGLRARLWPPSGADRVGARDRRGPLRPHDEPVPAARAPARPRFACRELEAQSRREPAVLRGVAVQGNRCWFPSRAPPDAPRRRPGTRAAAPGCGHPRARVVPPRLRGVAPCAGCLPVAAPRRSRSRPGHGPGDDAVRQHRIARRARVGRGCKPRALLGGNSLDCG